MAEKFNNNIEDTQESQVQKTQETKSVDFTKQKTTLDSLKGREKIEKASDGVKTKVGTLLVASAFAGIVMTSSAHAQNKPLSLANGIGVGVNGENIKVNGFVADHILVQGEAGLKSQGGSFVANIGNENAGGNIVGGYAHKNDIGNQYTLGMGAYLANSVGSISLTDTVQKFDATNALYANAISNKAQVRLSKTLGKNFNIGASAGAQTVNYDGYGTFTKPSYGVDAQYMTDGGTLYSVGVKNQLLYNGDNNVQVVAGVTIPLGSGSESHANGNRFTKITEMQNLADQGSHFDSSLVREAKKENKETVIADPTFSDTNIATSYDKATSTIQADGGGNVGFDITYNGQTGTVGYLDPTATVGGKTFNINWY